MELERRVFKVIEDAGCGDQGEVFIGMLNLEELEVDKLRAAIAELTGMKAEYGEDAHDLLDKEIEVMEELVEKLEAAD